MAVENVGHPSLVNNLNVKVNLQTQGTTNIQDNNLAIWTVDKLIFWEKMSDDFVKNGIPYGHLHTSFFGFFKAYQNENVSVEKFCDYYQLIHENYKTFPTRKNYIT